MPTAGATIVFIAESAGSRSRWPRPEDLLGCTAQEHATLLLATFRPARQHQITMALKLCSHIVQIFSCFRHFVLDGLCRLRVTQCAQLPEGQHILRLESPEMLVTDMAVAPQALWWPDLLH